MPRAAVLGALLLSGCASYEPPRPSIQSVSPSQGEANVPTEIIIQLERPEFLPSFDYGARTVAVDTRVTVRLGDPSVTLELLEQPTSPTEDPYRVTALVPAGLEPGARDLRVTLADGREAVLSPGFTVLPASQTAFIFDPIAEQTVGVPFNVTIRVAASYPRRLSGTVTLRSGKGSVSPATIGSFVNGERTEQVTIDRPGSNWLIATDENGNTGASAHFLVKTASSVSP